MTCKHCGASKPRTVNAPSEFEALPVGSVVLLTSRIDGAHTMSAGELAEKLVEEGWTC